MKRLVRSLVALAAVLVATGTGQALTYIGKKRPVEPPDPEKIARVWFEAVARADIAAAMKLSSPPFFWDGTTWVPNERALELRYKDVARRRGVRTIVPDRIEPLDNPSRKRIYCGGDKGEVFLFWVGRQHVGICVRGAEVIGFKD